ncbi:unnamed protein product [Amoebophrya sp. A25]|nr:unnamed protein product [Amoebophrya sp. A25]|eukprot:GSA25T00007084001.1
MPNLLSLALDALPSGQGESFDALRVGRSQSSSSTAFLNTSNGYNSDVPAHPEHFNLEGTSLNNIPRRLMPRLRSTTKMRLRQPAELTSSILSSSLTLTSAATSFSQCSYTRSATLPQASCPGVAAQNTLEQASGKGKAAGCAVQPPACCEAARRAEAAAKLITEAIENNAILRFFKFVAGTRVGQALSGVTPSIPRGTPA